MNTRNSIAFLGVGNMGAAILGGVLKSGVFAPEKITLCDAVKDKCIPFTEKGCTYTESLTDAALRADCILLAVKPQQIDAVMAEIAPITAGKLILSIAAGVPIVVTAIVTP